VHKWPSAHIETKSQFLLDQAVLFLQLARKDHLHCLSLRTYVTMPSGIVTDSAKGLRQKIPCPYHYRETEYIYFSFDGRYERDFRQISLAFIG
jgi:hypothetical protein